MAFSNEFREHIFNQNSGQAEIWLLRLISPNGEFPTVFLCGNNEDLTSNSQVYTAFPFLVVVGDETSNEPSQFAIEFDNVSLALVDEFRSIVNPPIVELDLVLGDFPDVVEVQFKDLKVVNISYDSLKISATLIYEDILNALVPSYLYKGDTFRGLFGG